MSNFFRTGTGNQEGVLVGGEDANGNPQVQKVDANGYSSVRIDANNAPYGSALQDDLWGDEVNKAALVNGSGKGPDYFYVDMRQYGRATLVVMMETGTVTHTATIDWSPSGDAAGDWHSSTALWTEQAGNQGAAITILDNFARITLTQVTGTAEAVYAYVVGRELP